MIYIKYLCIFSLSLFFGFILVKFARNCCESKNIALPFYTYIDDESVDCVDITDTTDNMYKENGEWIPLYQQYIRGTSLNTIDNAKLAGKIAEAIMICNFSVKYLRCHSMFRIYTINNDLWAVYEENTDKLLLLFQKKDCKMLYIANI